MRIAIDVSQIVYQGAGVARIVRNLNAAISKKNQNDDLIIFGVSFGQYPELQKFGQELHKIRPQLKLKIYPIPIRFMELIWNQWHIIPIGWLVGNVDVFWSSDWVQPPLQKAIGVTTVHDLSVIREKNSFNQTIINVQIQRMGWVKKECQLIFCDSISTQKDLVHIYNIPLEKTIVVYPGVNKL
jgi:hypothetical protein